MTKNRWGLDWSDLKENMTSTPDLMEGPKKLDQTNIYQKVKNRKIQFYQNLGRENITHIDLKSTRESGPKNQKFKAIVTLLKMLNNSGLT